MSKKPQRTRPLDRDGDGRDGGSLPGNKTAPMAEPDPELKSRAETIASLMRDNAGDTTPPAEEDHPPAETETETPPVEGEADAAPAETTQEGEGETGTDAPAKEDHPPAEGETGKASGDTEAIPAAEVAKEQDAIPAEAIRNGDTEVVSEEGETVQPASDTRSEADLVVIEPTEGGTEHAAAVRLGALRRLADNHWLYKGDDGLYGTGSGPGFVDEAEASLWVRHRLADFSPSAGRIGGIRVTGFGRKMARTSGEVALVDEGEAA